MPRGRDDSAKLRGLAGELALDPVRMPNRDTWQLLDAKGVPTINPRIQATGFRSRDAIAFMEAELRRRRARQAKSGTTT